MDIPFHSGRLTPALAVGISIQSTAKRNAGESAETLETEDGSAYSFLISAVGF